jgi:hypothetical protein
LRLPLIKQPWSRLTASGYGGVPNLKPHQVRADRQRSTVGVACLRGADWLLLYYLISTSEHGRRLSHRRR